MKIKALAIAFCLLFAGQAFGQCSGGVCIAPRVRILPRILPAPRVVYSEAVPVYSGQIVYEPVPVIRSSISVIRQPARVFYFRPFRRCFGGVCR